VAPSEETNSAFPWPAAPITVAPWARAICAAATPTPQPAPFSSTMALGWSLSRSMPSRAVAADTDRVAASVNDTAAGLCAVAWAGSGVYSA
jgi:hypothetical protein